MWSSIPDDTLLDLPCPSFLIEHPKGLVLFDTGCNPKVIDDAVGYWGEIARHLPLKWSKSETLDHQVRNVGYKPADVKYVILSHAHLDHAGGMTHFPKAKFIAGKNEIRYAYWPEPDRRGEAPQRPGRGGRPARGGLARRRP